jgi:DNA-binding transcriptional MerR regulator
MVLDAGWTLRELAAEVAAELARNYQPADNGQIRPVPDERAIRYYTTLGLVDGPSKLRGRTALYGARHLAQVVAIKRLQSAGKSLEDIQSLLPTLDDATLSRVSGIVVSRPARSRAQRPDFWKTEPALGQANARTSRVSDELSCAAAPPQAPSREPQATTTCNVTLAPGITLSFPASRALTRVELLAVATAAAPLLACIANLTPALVQQADPDLEPRSGG